MKNLIIAIDGPAASGKSTLAKSLALQYQLLYIDTGAMFRAITWAWFQAYQGHRADNLQSEEKRLSELLKHVEIKLAENSKLVYVNETDVSQAIRENWISLNTSYIASFKVVRTHLLEQQRALSRNHNVVLDGRDIGTVVFPNANLKIFLLASATCRAQRRQLELQSRSEIIELKQLIQEIEERDRLDSERSEAPLLQAQDAIAIDTDQLDAKQVLEKVAELIENLLITNS